MTKISLNEQIAETEYELAQRKRVYARLDVTDPRGKSEREYHVARMEAARGTLTWLQEHEATVKAAIGRVDMVDEPQRVLDMLVLCGEEGGKREGETPSQFLRRLIDALILAQRQPGSITAETIAFTLCCGKDHCNAAEHCADHELSPEGYALRVGCETPEIRRQAGLVSELLRAKAEKVSG